MGAIDRRTLITACGLAAAAALLPARRGWAAPRGYFLHDAALDPAGTIAGALHAAGWSIVPMATQADLLLHRLDGAAHAPAALAGLTRPATRFAFEQVARRRGMRPVDMGGAVWAFDGGLGTQAR